MIYILYSTYCIPCQEGATLRVVSADYFLMITTIIIMSINLSFGMWQDATLLAVGISHLIHMISTDGHDIGGRQEIGLGKGSKKSITCSDPQIWSLRPDSL